MDDLLQRQQRPVGALLLHLDDQLVDAAAALPEAGDEAAPRLAQGRFRIVLGRVMRGRRRGQRTVTSIGAKPALTVAGAPSPRSGSKVAGRRCRAWRGQPRLRREHGWQRRRPRRHGLGGAVRRQHLGLRTRRGTGGPARLPRARAASGDRARQRSRHLRRQQPHQRFRIGGHAVAAPMESISAVSTPEARVVAVRLAPRSPPAGCRSGRACGCGPRRRRPTSGPARRVRSGRSGRGTRRCSRRPR